MSRLPTVPSSEEKKEAWTSPTAGMEFVWVKALRFWVGKYEVTNHEYRKKEPDHDSTNFNGLSLNGDRQPAVYVHFNAAKAYAEWLTQRDRATGTLPDGYRYRLPSMQEFRTLTQGGGRFTGVPPLPPGHRC